MLDGIQFALVKTTKTLTETSTEILELYKISGCKELQNVQTKTLLKNLLKTENARRKEEMLEYKHIQL